MALLPSLLALAKTFWIPITLYLVRNGLNLYRQLRATYNSNQSRIKPLSHRATRALNILFFSALTCLILTTQAPPNVFRESESKLQASPDVIFSRLRHRRPLTPADETLKEKLLSKESKLLYLAYGHDAFANCTYCTDATSYLLYALPNILLPHLLHALALGLCTSALLSGAEGTRFRPHTTLTSLALAAGELYLTYTYNIAENVKSTRWTELDFFSDNARLYRYMAFIVLDMGLAGVLWLSSTQRLFVRPLTTSEQLQNILQGAEAGLGRQWAAGAVMNAVGRDRVLRERWGEYWGMEGEVASDRVVLEAEKRALERVDARQLVGGADKQAGNVVDRILPGVLQPGGGG